MLAASVTTLAVPVAVAAVTMGVAFLLARDAEPWADLGLIVYGMGAALVLGVVALLVTARLAFARALPPGQRLRPAAAAVLGLAVSLVLLSLLADAAGAWVAVVLLLTLPVVLPLAVTGHLGRR